METRIQLRGDTAANWASNNPTLAAREFAVETDTLRIKVGNGSDAYNTLQYASVPAYNGLDKAVAGNSLDARQGKVLKDAVDSKAPLANPVFTGVISILGAQNGISTNQSGTAMVLPSDVEFEDGQDTALLTTIIGSKAPKHNPSFTGTVLVPYTNIQGSMNQAVSFNVVEDRVPRPDSGSNGLFLKSSDDGTAGWANPLGGSILLHTRIANVGPISEFDSVLFGNTTWSIELPAAASNSGRVLRLICNSASTPYVFNPGQSDSIIKKDGSVITFPSMFEIAAPYGSVTLISDGISKWYSI